MTAWTLRSTSEPFERCLDPVVWPAVDFVHKKGIAKGKFNTVDLYEVRSRPVETFVVKRWTAANVEKCSGPTFLENPKTEMGVGVFLTTSRVPYIVKTIDIYKDHTTWYAVSECAAYGDLMRRVVKLGPMREAEVKRICTEIFRALAGMHDIDVAHRDVSLENIALHEDGSARLLDFAQAVRIERDEAGKEQRCAFGGAGKAPYRPPETKGGMYAPSRMDSFGMGVVMCALLTGILPWKATDGSDKRWVLAKQRGIVHLLEAWKCRDAVSADGLDLLNRLIHPDPAARISCRAALSHPWLAGVSVTPYNSCPPWRPHRVSDKRGSAGPPRTDSPSDSVSTLASTLTSELTRTPPEQRSPVPTPRLLGSGGYFGSSMLCGSREASRLFAVTPAGTTPAGTPATSPRPSATELSGGATRLPPATPPQGPRCLLPRVGKFQDAPSRSASGVRLCLAQNIVPPGTVTSDPASRRKQLVLPPMRANTTESDDAAEASPMSPETMARRAAPAPSVVFKGDS